jgi:hypothetical protein
MAALTVTAARVAPVNETQYLAKTYIAVAAVTPGQPVYLDSAGKAAIARANATGTVQNFLGLTTHAAAAGKPVEVLIRGSIYGFDLSGLAYGAKVYVLASAAGQLDGAITTGTGNFVVVVGMVESMTDGSDLTKVLFVDVRHTDIFVAL